MWYDLRFPTGEDSFVSHLGYDTVQAGRLYDVITLETTYHAVLYYIKCFIAVWRSE